MLLKKEARRGIMAQRMQNVEAAVPGSGHFGAIFGIIAIVGLVLLLTTIF
jgi:hypothetical protein